MSIDLTQFHESFYDESFEALGSMEENLLRLDVGAPESDRVNTIFRVAHSIKGGAATFGFTEITSFTHTLETLLDELRAQRMQVTRALMDLLLKAVDVMRDMLRAQQARQHAPRDHSCGVPNRSSAESTVLLISMAMVNGPTPPGTGV